MFYLTSCIRFLLSRWRQQVGRFFPAPLPAPIRRPGRQPPPWSLRAKAMTLTELLVVLAILGILLLLAFPVLKPLFSKTYALEAKTNLRHLAQLQHLYHMEHQRYSRDLPKLGFEAGKLVTEEQGTAHFQVEILQAGPEDFLARATAVTDFDGDGAYNVWEIDRQALPREVVPD